MAQPPGNNGGPPGSGGFPPAPTDFPRTQAMDLSAGAPPGFPGPGSQQGYPPPSQQGYPPQQGYPSQQGQFPPPAVPGPAAMGGASTPTAGPSAGYGAPQYGAPQYGAPPQGYPMGNPPYPQPYPQPGPGGDLQRVASADPQTVWIAELVGGIFSFPGIGHLMIGDTNKGLLLLIGYPVLVFAGWMVISVFTCGVGAVLGFLQLPINVFVGWYFANQVRNRVYAARQALGGQLPRPY